MSTYSETFRALRPTPSVVAVPRADIDVRRGLRLGAGVIVPLAVGVSLGHAQFGVFAAIGALTSGFAATTGARAAQHAAAVLISAVGMASAAFAGASLAHQPWPLLAALMATTYAAGSFNVFSQRIGIATMQWPVALLIATTSSTHPWQWAALLLAGGAWQALLTALDRSSDHDATATPPRAEPRRLGARLSAGLDPRFEQGQHLLRLTIVAALVHVVAVLAGVSHGYWAAITALLVLKPDHTTTIRRSLDRIGGTAFGVLLGVLLAGAGDLGRAPLLLVAGFTVCLAYTVFCANYFVFCVFMTGFIVLLLDLLGQSAAETAVDRLVATALGGTIALAASHIRFGTGDLVR